MRLIIPLWLTTLRDFPSASGIRDLRIVLAWLNGISGIRKKCTSGSCTSRSKSLNRLHTCAEINRDVMDRGNVSNILSLRLLWYSSLQTLLCLLQGACQVNILVRLCCTEAETEKRQRKPGRALKRGLKREKGIKVKNNKFLLVNLYTFGISFLSSPKYFLK